ncbi:hypothetical protein MMC13_001205 [Lambiella insularis]|nr:hypothetical protein [Lambiella insularis]
MATLAQLSDTNPPAKGGRLGPPIELYITAAIRTGTPYRAQIVRVEVPAFSESERNLVAKFYDPLQTEDSQDPEVNSFYMADDHYVTETAAYDKLKSLQGTSIPKFYGTYTCDLPTGLGNSTRSIRLILIEYIQGTVMSSFSESTVCDLSQAARQNIMYKIVDSESRAYAAGVRHFDLHPRNVILEVEFRQDTGPCIGNGEVNFKLADPTLRLRLIDFANAKLAPFHYEPEEFVRRQRNRAVSPLLRWHVKMRLHQDFQDAGWVDWDWQKWTKECWGKSTFYEPVTRRAEDEWLFPEWPRVATRWSRVNSKLQEITAKLRRVAARGCCLKS